MNPDGRTRWSLSRRLTLRPCSRFTKRSRSTTRSGSTQAGRTDRIPAGAALAGADRPGGSPPRPSKGALHDLVRGRDLADLGGAALEALAGVDGAVVTDREGRLLAFGAILRGQPGPGAVEGARASAAIGASFHGPVLKVSEDGSLAMYLDGRRAWAL